MPIYKVEQKEGGSDVRLVDAKNATAALKHVVADMFEANLCDGKDLHRLAMNGVELETAESEPTQETVAEPAPLTTKRSEPEATQETVTPPPGHDEFGPIDEDLNAQRAAEEG